MAKLHAYILAGGRSARGSLDKALTPLCGRPRILALAETIRPAVASVTAVANHPDKFEDLGLRTIGDLIPSVGPLGGLLSALYDARPGQWILLLSVNQTSIRPHWILDLCNYQTEPHNIVLFQESRPEPFFALYHTSLIPLIQAQIARNRLTLEQLIATADPLCLPFPSNWPASPNLRSRPAAPDLPSALPSHL